MIAQKLLLLFSLNLYLVLVLIRSVVLLLVLFEVGIQQALPLISCAGSLVWIEAELIALRLVDGDVDLAQEAGIFRVLLVARASRCRRQVELLRVQVLAA